MAPTPPILSAPEDLNLPDIEKILIATAIPASADLTALNEKLADLAASAQARADALRRDLEILQQTYASLKQKIRKGKDESLQAAVAGRQSSVVNSAKADASPQTQPMKKRKSENGLTTNGTGGGGAIARLLQTPMRQPSPSTLPEPSLKLPDRAVPTVELTTTSDPEEMKRRLGVAYFPTQDLSHLLPGTPSNEDYSKQKIPSQIAVSTFQASIEPFFRPLTEEDLGWLRDRGDQLAPFIIPPLGTHYSELWNDPVEDTPAPKQELTQKPLESAEHLNDDNLQIDSVSCGPITSRVLSAFIKEDDSGTKGDEIEGPEKEKASRITAFRMDYAELEDKMIGELNFIGLIDSNPIDWSQTADDEISSNLRVLQGQLHIQSKLNAARKQRLMSLTTDEMAKDEYTTILDDLDKQVEQAFLKRTRSIKATKKKRNPGEKGVAVSKMSIGSNIRSLIEKRQKWIQRIGSICTTEPVTQDSIFADLDLDTEQRSEASA